MRKDPTAPLPLSASRRAAGLHGALWLAGQRSGVFTPLPSLRGEPRSDPSAAPDLPLAAFDRIAPPGPKTKAADGYRQSLLHSLWGFASERFSSQALRDCFPQLLPENKRRTSQRDAICGKKHRRAAGSWEGKASDRWAYGPTNFPTYLASTRTRRAQRGHNKQGRRELRQGGLGGGGRGIRV